ncbi:MAG TPA: threonine--tRNA ligase, partial [Bdellovibrionota bacterium]|nr:threonine--tRNA ligase [Bdellovibrionota bacterium]
MSKQVNIELPDGSKKKYPAGITAQKIVEDIGPGLAKAALGALVNEVILDLQTPIQTDSQVKILTEKDKETLEILRHSTTHVMAQAIKRLYKEQVEITIGPVIENGYFYDFSFKKPISVEDLQKIENEMQKIAKENFPITRRVMAQKDATKFFKKMGENYKAEIIKDLKEKEVSLYDQGEFTDLCRGPHLPRTGFIKAFKLLSVAGAYWRGDEKNEMLTRVYGTAFFKKEDLDQYLHLLEEAKKRDHRKLGKDLDLFSFHPESPAMPFFHEKGVVIYEKLIEYIRKNVLSQDDYKLVKTPLIYRDELWKKSGHYENYKENMYLTEQDGESMAVKPMNCPGHILVFKTAKHSYRELPIRIAEFGYVHRYERSGVVQGLFRVRSFAQDDAHHFCTEDQIESEVTKLIRVILKAYKDFQFQDVRIELSTRPKKSTGTDAMWKKAEAALEGALKKTQVLYKLNPGDGAFYGPKIDFHIRDSLNRTWQCGTIQLDFSMPERFNVTYVDSDSREKNVVMIHRAIMGSPERFMGILIEHFGGHFPVWLATIQVVVITLTDDQRSYAEKLCEGLKKAGIRLTSDFRNEKLGFKIREAQLQKYPYMVIIGKQEVESQTVS